MPPPLPRRRRSGARRLIAAVALALVAHALMVGVLLLAGSGPRPVPGKAPPQAVAMRTLSSEEWDRNRGRSAPTDRKVPELPKPSKQQPKGQVVAVAPGNDLEPPEDSKFLAETNNRLEKQTRSRETRADYQNAMPQRTTDKAAPEHGSSDREQEAQDAYAGVLTPEDTAKSSGEARLEFPRAEKRTAVALKQDPRDAPGPGVAVENRKASRELKGSSDRLVVSHGGQDEENTPSSTGQGQRSRLKLLPSAALMAQISGAAAPDQLDDVEEGDGTFLNTREFRHAGFYNRLKQAVVKHWNPSEALDRRDPTRAIYGSRDRVTVLNISLDAEGRIRDLSVVSSSGLDFLDVEAMKAFQKAQPFPNLPSALLGGDSMLHFRFGFTVEMGSRPTFRIHRNAN